MVRCHREGVNWREQELDPMTLYTSEGGKSMDGESMVLFQSFVLAIS
jgi:hypothetical protein